MNKNSEPAAAQMLEKLTTLFYLMVGLPLLAFTWVYLNLAAITPSEFFAIPALQPYFHGGVLFTSLAIAVLAFVQYRRRFSGLEPSSPAAASLRESLNYKVAVFREASLKKYVLLTISTLLVIGGFYFSAEENYAAAYSILLILFSINRPTTERLVRDMRLKKEEREALYQSMKEYRQEQQEK